MKKNVIPFQFQDHQIRTVVIDGEPAWVAKDICEVLDLSDVSKAVKALDADEKGTHKVRTLGGMQEMITINESGLFALVIRSNKQQAKAFRKWITSEVLPSIRKTGSYSAEPQHSSSPQIPYTDAVDGVAAIARHMNFSNSAKAQAFCGVSECYGVPSDILQLDYVVDEGLQTTGSSRASMSMTDLLKEHNVGISSRRANAILVQLGYLHTLSRQSTRGIKSFKSISEKGLNFGKNITSPANQKETQPHWFVDTFSDLLVEIKEAA